MCRHKQEDAAAHRKTNKAKPGEQGCGDARSIPADSPNVCVRRTYGSRRPSEGQTQQHQQRYELIARLHVGHGEVTVVATEANHRRGQHICQLQEVQGHQGGQDDGELDARADTHTRPRTKQRESGI